VWVRVASCGGGRVALSVRDRVSGKERDCLRLLREGCGVDEATAAKVRQFV